jgi:hypothetical protein
MPAVNAVEWLFTMESWAGAELHALMRITSERVKSKVKIFLNECVMGRLASCERTNALPETSISAQ